MLESLFLTAFISMHKFEKICTKLTSIQYFYKSNFNTNLQFLAKLQWQKASGKLLDSKKPFGLDITSLKLSPENEKKVIDVFLRFHFEINSVVINLYTAPNEGLARFGLYYFVFKGSNLVDGSITTSIALCDVNLDDKRPNRDNMITRFMERRDQDTDQYMIDVTFSMKENDIYGAFIEFL